MGSEKLFFVGPRVVCQVIIETSNQKQSSSSTIKIENFSNQVSSPLFLFQLWNDLHSQADHHLIIEHLTFHNYYKCVSIRLKITCESSALPGSATSQPVEFGFMSVSTNFLCGKYGHCSDNIIK